MATVTVQKEGAVEKEVCATDPAAKADVQAWSGWSGNEDLEAVQDGDHPKIVVKITKEGR